MVDRMKRIEIADTTVMGIAGRGESIGLVIFLEETVELEMSLNVAKVLSDILDQAIDMASEGVVDRTPPADPEERSDMEILLRPDGRIAFGFGDIEQAFTDEEAMKIAQTIARILRHKQIQAREAA